MALISVITPAYKAQDTILRAVRSLQLQTHADWEMIIISDDGSDYAATLSAQVVTDARLRFESTGGVGSGPSRGRNIGLDMARGEYCTTLDADDEYHPQYLEKMLSAAEAHGVAMVLLGYRVNREGIKKPLFTEYGSTPEFGLMKLEEFCRVNGRNVTLFKRSLLKHRYLESMSYGEDFLFDMRFFEYVDAIPVFSQEYYVYHDNPNSITRSESADYEFIEHYKRAISTVEADATMAKETAHAFLAACHHRLFQNHLYLRAKLKKQCSDFFDFMAKYPEYFR